MSTALPKPDWCREGETWRVEEEQHLVVGQGLCTARPDQYGYHPCDHEAIAVGRTNRRLALCLEHLGSQAAWIENGKVVSWRLSK